MFKTRSLAFAACIALAGLGGATLAAGASDPTQYLPSKLPGYAKTQEKCMRCHTAEPMTYQPQDAPRSHWELMVKRMKRVFKAKIDDAEMADLVDYFSKTYGNEREGLAAPANDASATSATSAPSLPSLPPALAPALPASSAVK